MKQRCIVFLFISINILFFGHSIAWGQSNSTSQVEEAVVYILSPHLERKKYFVSVKAENAVVATQPQVESEEEGTSILPFTTLKINLAALKNKMLGKSEVIAPTDLPKAFEVSLIFDTSVSEDISQLLQEKLRSYLNIDDQTRSLRVSSKNLVKIEQDPKNQSDEESTETGDKGSEIELQTAKLENERTKLQMERDKFESLKKTEKLEEEMRKAKEDNERKIRELEDSMKNKAVPEVIKEETLFETIQKFQMLLVAVIVSVIILLVTLIGSGSFKKGLVTLSEALTSVGESLASAGADGGDETSAMDAKADLAENQESVNQAKSNEPTENDERYIEFLKLVEEKIEVLSAEGNFNFYRHFVDLIGLDVKFAAAILASVSGETSKKLMSCMSPDSIALVRDFLSSPGAISKAQSLRGAALQDFYGRIAVDEYLDSPLLGVKGVEWLFELSTSELKNLSLQLEGEVRVAFLACLTPVRLAMIIENAVDSSENAKLIESVKQINEISVADINVVFVAIEKAYKEMSSKTEETIRRLVDGPQFFAQLVTELKPENRENLLNVLADKSELLEAMKKYYIPFDAVASIAVNTVKDIFGKRPAQQVAKIIFPANEEVRTRVISVMPEKLQDTVKEDLAVFDEDSENAVKNKAEALVLQDEICKYLLKLNREGLLVFEDSAGAAAAEASATASEVGGAA